MKALKTEARVENLQQVLAFIDEELETADCPMKQQMQVEIAVEEIYVNIASYAYAPGTGTAEIRIETREEPKGAVITFIDSGRPYNPLEREDPDITLSAEEREAGGLGVFLVKKNMDEVRYDGRDGQNILTITKTW